PPSPTRRSSDLAAGHASQGCHGTHRLGGAGLCGAQGRSECRASDRDRSDEEDRSDDVESGNKLIHVNHSVKKFVTSHKTPGQRGSWQASRATAASPAGIASPERAATREYRATEGHWAAG